MPHAMYLAAVLALALDAPPLSLLHEIRQIQRWSGRNLEQQLVLPNHQFLPHVMKCFRYFFRAREGAFPVCLAAKRSMSFREPL